MIVLGLILLIATGLVVLAIDRAGDGLCLPCIAIGCGGGVGLVVVGVMAKLFGFN